nr:DUF1015 domain-containing protein [bacterium]
MNDTWDALGLSPATILLPAKGVDLAKWAVVACDQYTSQPGYWQQVEQIVGNVPSTLHLMLPEVYLGAPDEKARQQAVLDNMAEYRQKGVFAPGMEGMVLVRRQVSAGVRTGLVAAIDLEQYDFSPDSHSLIRATERTIAERLPPRVAIRSRAELELPHVMLLIDDPHDGVLGPLARSVAGSTPLYDINLMQHGGHITGWRVPPGAYPALRDNLAALAVGEHPILFAVGDGNHSLATAKVYWQQVKAGLTPDQCLGHPARYCLVEIVNLHDPALVFHPIHRVLFGIDGGQALDELAAILRDMGCQVNTCGGLGHSVQTISCHGKGILCFERPGAGLPLTLLQPAVETLLARHPDMRVDYVHGDDAARQLAAGPNCLGLLIAPLDKSALFTEVNANGPLQLKTFSMGEADDKRFYMECRAIR